ncbi:MAG: FkbM family methyltransferase [Saprospiraceae bacterium]
MRLSYQHLPDWLKQNWLFRKLFLIRKLFLTRSSRRHYGQSGEDIFIVRQFPKEYQGFFVDVGCFHPTKYNNTYQLYQRGWRGVNIDIDRIKIEAFDLRRPDDTNIQRAVSTETGELTYWTNGFYSLVVTLDEDFTKEREKYDYRPAQVQADTLTDILDATEYKDQSIDFLTVDAEGHDLPVLQSLDFERYDPQLIAVEMQESTLDEILESELYQFLTEQEYIMVNWLGQTLMFKPAG